MNIQHIDPVNVAHRTINVGGRHTPITSLTVRGLRAALEAADQDSLVCLHLQIQDQPTLIAIAGICASSQATFIITPEEATELASKETT